MNELTSVLQQVPSETDRKGSLTKEYLTYDLYKELFLN